MTYAIALPAWAHATLERAMRVRGLLRQLWLLQEECLEPALAISHLERGRQVEDEVREELADVLVMALQIRERLGVAAVDAHVVRKLERLRRRMEQGDDW